MKVCVLFSKIIYTLDNFHSKENYLLLFPLKANMFPMHKKEPKKLRYSEL